VSYPNAIYLGKYSLSGGTPVSSSVDMSGRQLLQLRPMEVGTLQADIAARTEIYDVGQAVTLEEHVNAQGSATSGPTPNNPHAYAISDIEGGGAEPLNAQYQSEVMSKGLIDPDMTRTSPIPVPAVLDPFLTNVPTPYVGFAVADGQALYVLGQRIDVATDIPSMGPVISGFITMPFSNLLDSAGDWTIYVGVNTSTGIPVVTLNKIQGTLPVTTGTFDTLVLATVWWSGTALRKTQFRNSSAELPVTTGGTAVEVPATPVDQRSIGLVGAAQLATDAVSSPASGLFANEFFTNRLFNSAFYDRWSSADNLLATSINGATPAAFLTTNAPRGWDKVDVAWPGSVALGTINTFVVIDGSVDSTMRTTGPKLDAALKLAFTAATGPYLDVQIRGRVSDLKPNTTYLVTGWIKMTAVGGLGSPVNTAINLLAGFMDASGSLRSTAYKTVAFANNLPAPVWQRVSALVTTASTVDVNNDNRLVLRFATQSIAPQTLADIYLADWSVTEGEWYVKSENMRPQGYQLRGFLNSGGTVNPNTNPGPGTYTIMDIVLPSRGQVASIHGGLSIRGGQNNTEEVGAVTLFLEIDGVIVSFLIGRIDGLTVGVGNIMYAVTWPFRVSFSGYLAPGIHRVKLRWVSGSTNGWSDWIENYYGALPEMSVLLL
jgi:hypothetical protein